MRRFEYPGFEELNNCTWKKLYCKGYGEGGNGTAPVARARAEGNHSYKCDYHKETRHIVYELTEVPDYIFFSLILSCTVQNTGTVNISFSK